MIHRLSESALRQRIELIWRLAARELAARYRGSVLGILWAFVTPILTVLLYSFVFSAIFKARWGGHTDSAESSFTMILLTGTIVHTVFAECLGRAPGLMLANANYVKKVVFPLEILPVVVVVSALANAAIGVFIIVIGNAIVAHTICLTIPLILLVMLPYALFVLSIVYLFAALGTYLRDLTQLVMFISNASLFLTPILYPISAVPVAFQTAMRLNPLTTIVEAARDVLLFNRLPDFEALGIMLIGVSLLLVGTRWLFKRLQGGFADVL